ncbi:zinc-finger homeodomain protein 4-like [Juglans microcarpa x Juglans regia]|uniref:zinc-finger homeodomain protein 4-like n=1 Tax=Juglans microcarpa x Juglans regia TaxID=2249226 RepID=UPI001B7E69BB|nr:zinc-finger homeodomain protein 4-like [Juglans microcarpa x Juglans regia]
MNNSTQQAELQLPRNDCHAHKKVVRYKECHKNHAAENGGNATDGCGEFMPNGEEGTFEALKCSACNCHRNFHRKEIESDSCSCQCYHTTPTILNINARRSPNWGHHEDQYYNAVLGSSIGCPTTTMMISYKSGSVPSESNDEKEDAYGSCPVARPANKVKKRFRTKFTKEQKEKMLSFAEKAGWRMQKLEESVVQQFCQETGINKRVLKVWMHNNKHHFANKNSTS